jgi:hypothetical protein
MSGISTISASITYNTNTIYNDSNANRPALQLLFERVTGWSGARECGGSPMKRVGDIGDLDNLNNVDAREWNHFRIEVRADSIRLTPRRSARRCNWSHVYDDTRWSAVRTSASSPRPMSLTI